MSEDENNQSKLDNSFRNGQQQYVADIEFTFDSSLTESNHNRPSGLPPMDSDVYQLPWLRGHGNVPSWPIAYQQDPALRQAARDLIAQGSDGILHNLESFMAKWTGLESAHQEHGVIHTDLTIVSKVWMLETITGGAIEAANDAEERLVA